MKLRVKKIFSEPAEIASTSLPDLPTRVACWLLDRPSLGEKPQVKRLAGRMLKQPARQGVVAAQSRLGKILCCECEGVRDRRVGQQMLRAAARAGDAGAQLEMGRLAQRARQVDEARHWLSQAAVQGLSEAQRLLEGLD